MPSDAPFSGNVHLRAAEAGDAGAVTEVFLASRTATMPYLPRLHSDEATLGWITHVVLPDTRVWLAEDAGTGALLGFASLDGTLLDHLYLRPDVRRRGIGTLLLEAVRSASPRELSLHVFQKNTEARAFYERHGFVVVETNDGSRNEENEPDMTYRWTA
ncbi:GNAT family N-acetyltransferase [Kitasatospora sp. Ki12]|uniref:GNAT family N-acetyltransferase n=1 Tax=Kitasatospora xanthocidica TaxID=83382 RepID=UPI001679D6DF|nr:GNAT family N-acetyltransferase [Kitasatospora xanthocidica]GHF63578.1 histone acetyltransferase [Kitasatospora xanthocidica]